MSFASSSNESPAGTPPPGSPIASDTSQPTAQCHSCRRNAQTLSSSRQPSVIAVNFGSGCSVRGEPHRRTRDEFEQHARAVAALWGRRLLQCRTVFLAGSDALLLPAADVKSHLKTIHDVLAASAGSEPGPTATKSTHFWMTLSPADPIVIPGGNSPTLGLNRVSIGIASGDPAVRALHHQHWSDQDLPSVFADLKSAGIGASVLTLVGSGGADHAESHVTKTAALIESLALSPGDFVFLLDENELHDAEHVSQQPPLARTGMARATVSCSSRHSLRAQGPQGQGASYTMEKQRI